MTPGQIALVTETVRSLDLALLAVDFYRRVFQSDAALAAMFTTDEAVQRARFAAELAALVETIEDLDTFCSSAAALGVRHRSYGARSEHYRLMGVVLLATLGAALGDGWTADVEEAWTRAYDITAETMMAGALATRPSS